MSTLSDRLNTLNSWNSSTQTEQAPAQVQQAVQPNQTIYDMVKEYGKPYDYNRELQQAERSRKLGMLTDFIKSATDFGSALAGRRTVSPMITRRSCNRRRGTASLVC